MFDSFDSDKQGMVASSKFEDMLDEIGEGFHGEEMERQIAIIDPEGSGQLHRLAFIKWYQELVNNAANNDDGSEQTAGYIAPWCRTTNANANTNEQQQIQLIEQLVNPTSHQIQSYILHGRNHGTLYEPLLPVPTISTYKEDESIEMREVNARYRKGTLQLLQEEIKFQMRRTLKQLVGGKKLSIDTLFDVLHANNEEDGRDTDCGHAKKTKKKSKKPKPKWQKSVWARLRHCLVATGRWIVTTAGSACSAPMIA